MSKKLKNKIPILENLIIIIFIIFVSTFFYFGLKNVLTIGKLFPNSKELITPVVSIETSIQKTINNVVHIRNNTGGLQGSGVLISPDLILTARHVVDNSEDFEVMTNDGKIYKTTRAISSKKYDLGFIKLDIKLPCTTKVGSIDDCHLGQFVYAIGSPFGDVNFNSVTFGIISSLKRDLEKYDCPKEMGWSVTFQTDAAGHPGNSGCPVFTSDGIVRGILVGGFSNSLVYCVPVELVSNDCQMVQLMFGLDKYQIEQRQEPVVIVHGDN